MTILTRDFGEVEIESSDIITFTQPIFGFEELSKFVFLFDDEISEHFVWLQSTEDSSVCFILTDPAVACPDYLPKPSDADLKAIDGQDYVCWLVTVIAPDFAKSTVNLKSPILVNPDKKLAIQTILEEDLPIRYSFVKSGKENG